MLFLGWGWGSVACLSPSEKARSFMRRLQAMVADQSDHCLNRGRGRLNRLNRLNRVNRVNRNRFLLWLAPGPHGPLKLHCRVGSAPQQRYPVSRVRIPLDSEADLAAPLTFSHGHSLGEPPPAARNPFFQPQIHTDVFSDLCPSVSICGSLCGTVARSVRSLSISMSLVLHLRRSAVQTPDWLSILLVAQPGNPVEFMAIPPLDTRGATLLIPRSFQQPIEAS